MNYRLIAADMDGTLLNDKSELTERTKNAILQVMESGALFVPATGRAMSGVEHINAIIDRDMPFITINGAVVIMGKSRRILVDKHLEFDLAKEVYNLGVSRGMAVVVWQGEKLWVSRDCKDTRAYMAISRPEINIINDMDELKEAGISKVLWIDTPENISRYHHEMDARYSGKLNCFPSRPIFLDFVSHEADKGKALEEIGKIYGIDRSGMIAVGDGYNDVSMIKFAGLGVAMENAPDDVKAICGHVTLSNNEDGVAAVIEKFILNKL